MIGALSLSVAMLLSSLVVVKLLAAFTPPRTLCGLDISFHSGTECDAMAINFFGLTLIAYSTSLLGIRWIAL